MKNGFNADEFSARLATWNLGKPIDVEAFLDRNDIPEEAKQRVLKAGHLGEFHPTTDASDAQYGEWHRLAQAQILIEAFRLAGGAA